MFQAREDSDLLILPQEGEVGPPNKTGGSFLTERRVKVYRPSNLENEK